jgi:hypothetical protein
LPGFCTSLQHMYRGTLATSKRIFLKHLERPEISPIVFRHTHLGTVLVDQKSLALHITPAYPATCNTPVQTCSCILPISTGLGRSRRVGGPFADDSLSCRIWYACARPVKPVPADAGRVGVRGAHYSCYTFASSNSRVRGSFSRGGR